MNRLVLNLIAIAIIISVANAGQTYDSRFLIKKIETMQKDYSNAYSLKDRLAKEYGKSCGYNQSCHTKAWQKADEVSRYLIIRDKLISTCDKVAFDYQKKTFSLSNEEKYILKDCSFSNSAAETKLFNLLFM